MPAFVNSNQGVAERIDMHVHLVGTGSSGSGCRLRLHGLRRQLARVMLHHVGLPYSALAGDFDRLYVDRLLDLVRTSSLQRIVLLAQDDVYRSDGSVMEGVGSFYVPNDYVLDLADKNPEFLPAVSIHPARKDALAELNKCIERGAVMMKCLPNCHNIDISDRRYTRFWERMAEAGLPLLAHTGGEHTVPVVNAAFASPGILDWPLQCGVTVIAAHCGTKSGLTDPDYFQLFISMLEKHPKLYGDISALTLPFRSKHLLECSKSGICERLVHGSDFPVPIYAIWSRLRGFINNDDGKRCSAIKNPLERDYQIKRAVGFPDEVFMRIGSLLPKIKKPGQLVRG